MLTLEQLRRQVESAEDLRSITKAMKALAAVRIRQSRRAVESLEDYGRTVELGLQVALRSRPREVRLAGVDEEAGPGVGAQGQPVARRFHAPDSIDAVTPTVQQLLVAIQEARQRQGMDRFDLYYNHYHSGATYRPHVVHLLPVNVEWLTGVGERSWPSRVLPTFRVPWDRLFTELVREHLFVSLYAAAARSQASENASRLASMEAAERRIDERLSDLQGRFNQQRQQQITEELLDLVTGFLALEEGEES